jgi:hypothetical protein
MHPSCLSEEELLKQCELRNDRRSGPGGQHRNKVETAVIVLHRPTSILAEASERRKQAENRRVAIFRLRLALAVGYRSGEQPSSPSPLWRSRVQNKRIAVSAEHVDFPCLLAELLDFLDRAQYQMPATAEHFGVAASQLVKMLRQFSPALVAVNRARAELGMHKLS